MSPLPRRTMLSLAVGGLLAVPAAARAMDAQAVIAPIDALDGALLTVMKAGKKTSFAQRYQMLAPTVLRVFDLGTILQVSIGSGWSGIPTQMQSLLLDEFARYTIASYVANFDSWDGQQFQVSPGLRPVGQDQVVQTTLGSPGGKSTRLDYVMRDEGGSWKIVDVLLEGTISRVAVQRSDFRQVFNTGGTQALITMLRQKVAELSHGAMT